MTTPNSVYEDTSIHGGIPVSSADIIRIFCDVERTIKVRRSIIKVELKSQTRFYTLDNPDIILKVNGTAVLVRATSLDMNKIYIFDPKTDSFLTVVNETIGVYGDRESMSDKDYAAIGRHGKKLKRIEDTIRKRFNSTNEQDEQEDFFDLEVLETSSTKQQIE